MEISLVFPLLKQAAQVAINAVTDGVEIGPNGIGAIQIAYNAANVFLTRLVESTETPYDDEAMDVFMASCEHAARKRDFPLPILAAVGE